MSDKLKTDLAKRNYIQIYLRATNEQTYYRLEGYDILSYFGDLGGLFDALYISG